ncbi:hypothetical protein [Guptibacillus hwajinpoensis]
MCQDVLTIPASGTIKIISEHSIHAYPHPMPFKDKPFVAFRETGGYIEKLYSVSNQVVLHPTRDDLHSKLAHLDQETRKRILTYIQDRKKGFGFEKPESDYMFWVLKEEKELSHRPKLKHNTPGHVYFNYEDFISGNKIISKKGKHTTSGVFEYNDFRDNLLIDKYNPILQSMRSMKTKHLRSENSEDAITWNVFKSLQQINPVYWYPELISKGINQTSFPLKKQIDTNQIPNKLDIKLWQSIKPPETLLKKGPAEGATEVDVIIECEEFVWVIEAKYKSDISTGTTHDKERNQILRNIDVGSNYAEGRDFYFSLLILDDKSSSKGIAAVEKYSRELTEDVSQFEDHLKHRTVGLFNLQGLTVFYWRDLAAIFKSCIDQVEDEFEKMIATRVFNWLGDKEIHIELG